MATKRQPIKSATNPPRMLNMYRPDVRSPIVKATSRTRRAVRSVRAGILRETCRPDLSSCGFFASSDLQTCGHRKKVKKVVDIVILV